MPIHMLQSEKTIIHLNSGEIHFEIIAAHGEMFEYLWFWRKNAAPMAMEKLWCTSLIFGTIEMRAHRAPETFKAEHFIHRKRLILMGLWTICDESFEEWTTVDFRELFMQFVNWAVGSRFIQIRLRQKNCIYFVIIWWFARIIEMSENVIHISYN